MTTVCPKCEGKVLYGVKDKVPNWRCTECGHHKSTS